MHTNVFKQIFRIRLAAVLLGALVVSGCTVSKTNAPGLTGPSEFAQAISLTATPDFLVQDGVSQSRVEALARDANGKPISGLAIRWSMDASDGRFLDSNPVTITDANGRTSITVVAPPPPATRSTTNPNPTLNIFATPGGVDVNNATPRLVSIKLLTPSGTPLPNNLPVPVITIIPGAGTVGEAAVFDASSTTDEESACGSKCTYRWDFGDSNHDTGINVMHAYTAPGTYTVTLTVTDDRGGVASTTKSFTVSGTALTAVVVASPTNPKIGDTVQFDARNSTAPKGAQIVDYQWDFGNGQTGTGSVTTTSYGADRIYSVRLTITDSTGRTASTTTTITVSKP